MSQQNKEENTLQPSVIKDLPVDEIQSKDVKGGPIYIHVDTIEGDVTSAGHERWIE